MRTRRRDRVGCGRELFTAGWRPGVETKRGRLDAALQPDGLAARAPLRDDAALESCRVDGASRARGVQRRKGVSADFDQQGFSAIELSPVLRPALEIGEPLHRWPNEQLACACDEVSTRTEDRHRFAACDLRRITRLEFVETHLSGWDARGLGLGRHRS